SELVPLVTSLRRIGREAGFDAVAFGHAADGNIHVHLYREGAGAESKERFDMTARAIYAEAARLGGSVTGEHGVGLTARSVLALRRPPAFLAAMRTIKSALDPNGILNPGKMIPAVD